MLNVCKRTILIKYSLKELLENGHTISSSPEVIQCWVDIPIVGTLSREASLAGEKNVKSKPNKAQFRVCKRRLGNSFVYSVRKVLFDANGNVHCFSKKPVVLEVHEEFDEDGIVLMDKNVRECLEAFTKPVINLAEFEEYD